MNRRPSDARSVGVHVLFVAIAIPLAAGANIVDEEREIFVVRPTATEPAWTQTGVFLNSVLFDLPNATSRPNAQVGFMFTPGFSWSVLDRFEIRVGFPLVLNPDGTGDRELSQADRDDGLGRVPHWDSTPDFDLPGLQVGLKANLLGKKGADRFYLAVGALSGIPLGSYDEWSTNFMQPKTPPGHSNSFRIAPYVSVAYNVGRFSPQLQVGASVRAAEKVYDPDDPPRAGDVLPTSGHFDWFFNLALPYSFLYERTALILEVNGAFGEDVVQVFITPAVTFLPKRSPALLSFACMIPVLDDAFRGNEGFRFLVNFSYRLDMLGIEALDAEDEEVSADDETPPAGW